MAQTPAPLLHPVDVRKADGGQADYPLVKTGNLTPPALDHLLSMPPEAPYASEHEFVTGKDGLPLVADRVAARIAHKISFNLSQEPSLQAWVGALRPNCAQLFAVAFAIQLRRTLMVEPGAAVRLNADDPVIADACSIIHRPECLHALPTVDRIIGPMINGAGIMSPHQVAQLRSAGWRDAAGRDIDSFLLAGATRAIRATGKSSDLRFVTEPDRPRAEQIDSQLPAITFSVIGLLKYRGLILPDRKREYLRETIEAFRENGALTSIPESTDRQLQSKAIIVESYQETLELDRVNRLAIGQARSFDASAPASMPVPEAGDAPALTL